jgi:hypothetical protein
MPRHHPLQNLVLMAATPTRLQLANNLVEVSRLNGSVENVVAAGISLSDAEFAALDEAGKEQVAR